MRMLTIQLSLLIKIAWAGTSPEFRLRGTFSKKLLNKTFENVLKFFIKFAQKFKQFY